MIEETKREEEDDDEEEVKNDQMQRRRLDENISDRKKMNKERIKKRIDDDTIRTINVEFIIKQETMRSEYIKE
jgi:hypothetical protein